MKGRRKNECEEQRSVDQGGPGGATSDLQRQAWAYRGNVPGGQRRWLPAIFVALRVAQNGQTVRGGIRQLPENDLRRGEAAGDRVAQHGAQQHRPGRRTSGGEGGGQGRG